MHTLKRYKWTWLLLLIALGLAVYLAVNSLSFAKSKLPVIGEVQDFSLENVDGKLVTLADTQGKARLVYFFFTECPDVCPITTYMLSETQDLLEKDGSFGKDVNLSPYPLTRRMIRVRRSKHSLTASMLIMTAGIFCAEIRSKSVSLRRIPSKFLSMGTTRIISPTPISLDWWTGTISSAGSTMPEIRRT